LRRAVRTPSLGTTGIFIGREEERERIFFDEHDKLME
jgi:hypothetical protein